MAASWARTDHPSVEAACPGPARRACASFSTRRAAPGKDAARLYRRRTQPLTSTTRASMRAAAVCHVCASIYVLGRLRRSAILPLLLRLASPCSAPGQPPRPEGDHHFGGRPGSSTVASTGALATIMRKRPPALRRHWRRTRTAPWLIGVSPMRSDRTITSLGSCTASPHLDELRDDAGAGGRTLWVAVGEIDRIMSRDLLPARFHRNP